MSETPKTPGGISKTLLTPCRRVGLSRKWKKSCTSPFISPLNIETGSTPRTETKRSAEKRKQIPHDIENIDEQIVNNDPDNIVTEDSECDNVITTPSRPVQLPRRKKSRISVVINATENTPEHATETLHNTVDIDDKSDKLLAKASESKSQISSNVTENSVSQDIISDDTSKVKDNIEETEEPVVKLAVKKTSKKATKKKSGELSIKGIDSVSILKLHNSVSQNLFDTVTDVTPLSDIAKLNNVTNDLPSEQVSFNKIKVAIVKNFEDKKTSTGDLKKHVTQKFKKDLVEATLGNENNLSQISIISLSDEDDDFDLEKKTILVRRSYNKTAKPIKCKSTGSITQKDIDKLRKRIEMKKQQLRAKTNTAETKDLTDLIKKWRKGSHDALNELMELMKLKMPDKHNMDLSELLEMLKIPPDLIGYDVEHDCYKHANEIDLV